MRSIECVLGVGVALLVTTSPAFAEADDQTGSSVTVTFFHTADIHEHAAPLPRIAGFVGSRKRGDSNTLFVDSGDWFNRGELAELETRGEAIAAMLGAMGYDAMIPGNHEHSFGTPRLAELIDRYSLPVVAANVVWPEDIEPEYAEPFRIFDLEGVTVAIIGTTPEDKMPAIMMPDADDFLEVLPIEESIGDLVAMLEGHADIIVLLTHVGLEYDGELAEEFPAVDIILGGHDHIQLSDVYIAPGTDTIVQHSGSEGQRLGELTVVWDGEQVVKPELRLVQVTDELPTSAAVEEIHQQYVP